MIKNELTTFTLDAQIMGGNARVIHNIRVVTIDGNPWFVTKDVCEALGKLPTTNGGYTHHLECLDAAERRAVEKRHMSDMALFPGRVARVSVISESGLYKLALRSDKPEAKVFQSWVTKVVLPAIRKDGAYVMGEEKVVTGEMSEDELILKAVSILQAKVQRLAEEKALAAPGFNR